MQAEPVPAWTAVVLAGGRASRMGGIDKTQLVLEERTLLARVVAALPDDVPVVVVGPENEVPRPVRFVREEPPFGGPVAALAAAVPLVATSAIALVGGDMPAAAPVLVRLAEEWTGEDALVAVDAEGRRQPLCSVLATAAAAQALTALGDPVGRSMRDMLRLLDVTARPLDAVASALLVDVDAPEDLDRLT